MFKCPISVFTEFQKCLHKYICFSKLKIIQYLRRLVLHYAVTALYTNYWCEQKCSSIKIDCWSCTEWIGPSCRATLLFAEWNCIGSNAVRQLCTSSQFLLPFFSGGNEWLSVVLLIVWTESFCCLWRIILNGWFTVGCTVKCLIFCLCSVGLLYFHIISMVKRAHGDNNIQRHVLVRHAYRANCAIVNRNCAAWTTIPQYFSSNLQTWFSYFWLWKDICLSCLLVVTSHFLLMLVISKLKLFFYCWHQAKVHIEQNRPASGHLFDIPSWICTVI